MSLYVNPYFARATEQMAEVARYVQTFGSGALAMLDDQVWDRPLVLRSSRGAGKTSIMRMFTVESLLWVHHNSKSNDGVYAELQRRQVLGDEGIRKLGAVVSLDRDYRSLFDLQLSNEGAQSLFLRLLDSRILIAMMKAALALRGRHFPNDVGQFSLTGGDDPRVGAKIAKLGGPTGDGILERARETEHEVLRVLDALVASDIAGKLDGHSELYSLHALGHGISVNGARIDAQPLVMFDDGHKLEARQRRLLLDQLASRELGIARWYAERFEALSDQELLSALGEEGRDHVLLVVDDVARKGSNTNRRFSRGRHEKVLEEIARRRAAMQLASYADESQDFLSLIETDEDPASDERAAAMLEAARSRARATSDGDSRYDAWFESVEMKSGWDAIVSYGELSVLIARDQRRQPGLFGDDLGAEDLAQQSKADIRLGAALAIANQFRLPFYGGPETIIRLASHNVQQLLDICGELFSEMLVDISVGRRPLLELHRQHRVIRQASEKYWESIPRTVPHGRDVQALVREIIAIARTEAEKPTMPYPPGVTGTALLMAERAQLLDPDYRKRTPGADRLFAALASAVAHNVITADLDYSVKGNRYMVLYLNRLLSPRFYLPLNYGAFRERRLSDMIGWIQKLPQRGHSRPLEMNEALPL